MPTDGSTVLTVDGQAVSRSEFEQELSREIESTDASAPTPAQLEPMKKALVTTLENRILLLRAAKAKGVSVTPEQVDRAVLRIRADYPTERFDQVLASGHLTLAQLERKTAVSLTIDALFQKEVYARVGVTEEAIRHYYEKHQSGFQRPEEVHAAQIVVKGMDEAKRLLRLLKQGHTFAELARKYSLSADAKVGGDLGWFPRGVMPPQFDKVVFTLPVGHISNVVPTEYGYHLFEVLGRRPAQNRDLAQARSAVEAKLLEIERAKAQKDYVAALRAKASIHVDEAVLRSITGPSTERATRREDSRESSHASP